MKIQTTIVLLALSMVAATASPSTPVCSSTDCIFGTIIVSAFAPTTVSLVWTVFETPDVTRYRLLRLPAPASQSSSANSGFRPVRLAELRPAGESVAVERTYQVTDTAPPGVWTYRVEITRRHEPNCCMDTDPIVIADPPSCGVVDVCNHLARSFTRAPSSAGTHIRWLTSAENESVREYRLTRLAPGCMTSSCAAEIAIVDAAGTCGRVLYHGMTDAAPPGVWTYRLEVISASGATVCTINADDVEPPQ